MFFFISILSPNCVFMNKLGQNQKNLGLYSPPFRFLKRNQQKSSKSVKICSPLTWNYIFICKNMISSYFLPFSDLKVPKFMVFTISIIFYQFDIRKHTISENFRFLAQKLEFS